MAFYFFGISCVLSVAHADPVKICGPMLGVLGPQSSADLHSEWARANPPFRHRLWVDDLGNDAISNYWNEKLWIFEELVRERVLDPKKPEISWQIHILNFIYPRLNIDWETHTSTKMKLAKGFLVAANEGNAKIQDIILAEAGWPEDAIAKFHQDGFPFFLGQSREDPFFNPMPFGRVALDGLRTRQTGFVLYGRHYTQTRSVSSVLERPDVFIGKLKMAPSTISKDEFQALFRRELVESRDLRASVKEFFTKLSAWMDQKGI